MGSDAVAEFVVFVIKVSIRAPAWGATDQDAKTIGAFEFQFALPRGERLYPATFVDALVWFQFALPRGERRAARPRRLDVWHVSIRAPAWGATDVGVLVTLQRVVSIRAPAWGATGTFGSKTVLCACFNSRSRVGSDLIDGDAVNQRQGFNSRSRVGSDKSMRITAAAMRCFNSRSRVGSDGIGIDHLDQTNVSIRAPAWGATGHPAKQPGSDAFQFALPRGERHDARRRHIWRFCFNSRSRVGSDHADLAGFHRL